MLQFNNYKHRGEEMEVSQECYNNQLIDIFYEHPEILIDILEEAGCRKVRFDRGQIRAGIPGSKNVDKLWFNPTMNSGIVFKSGEKIHGDLYQLVGYFLNGELERTEKSYQLIDKHTKDVKLKSYDGMDYFIFWNEIQEKEQKLKSLQYSGNDDEYDDSKVVRYDIDSYMKYKGFIYGTHQSLIDEHIRNSQIKRYKIARDFKRKRILFPYLDPYTGELVGIQGRSTMSDEDREKYDVSKYLNYKEFDFVKKWFFFGLYENIAEINENKVCIIVEAEKSVMKFSRMKNHISIACGGSQLLSKRQLELLDDLLDPDVKIIIALDSDVEEGKVFAMTKQAASIRDAYYIYDRNKILPPKSAPIDEGPLIWKELWKSRVKVSKLDEWKGETE